MAGRRAYGSGGGASPDVGEACGVSNFFMLRASSSSPFLGSRSIVSFEDINNRNNRSNASIIGPLYENREENIIDDDLEDYLCHQNPEKKRRLSVEQVQFLEKCFDEENKLGPERKIQLAKELGLQPRQVAIWFQNRRARWKTKQLEKDYLALKASYDTLKADYDVLLNEKHKLNTEITVLSDKLMLHNKTEKPQIATISEGEVSKPPAKQEDILLISSKIDSADSESQHYSTGGVHLKTACDSSYIFESDLTREEEEGLRKTIFHQYDDVLPKLDGAGCFSDHQPRPPADGSCGLGFYMEDHAFWSWSY